MQTGQARPLHRIFSLEVELPPGLFGPGAQVDLHRRVVAQDLETLTPKVEEPPRDQPHHQGAAHAAQVEGLHAAQIGTIGCRRQDRGRGRSSGLAMSARIGESPEAVSFGAKLALRGEPWQSDPVQVIRCVLETSTERPRLHAQARVLARREGC